MITEISNQTGIVFDEKGYGNTKVYGVEVWLNGEQLIKSKPTTWSKLIKAIMEVIRPTVQKIVNENTGEEFESIFNKQLSKSVDESGIKEASSFSRLLFTKDRKIKSKIYNASPNRQINVYKDPNTKEDKLICAVFASEIIWVVNALVMSLAEFGYQAKVLIEYEYRNQLDKGTEEGFDREELAKDLASVYIYSSRLTTMIDNIAKKYGIDVINELKL